jgi:hypothetical protein
MKDRTRDKRSVLQFSRKEEEEGWNRSPNSHLSCPLLNVILARRTLTPRQHSDALLVERRDDVVPVLDDNPTRVELGLGLGEHVGLDGLEEGGDGGGDVGEGEVRLLRVVSSNRQGLALFEVFGADLETEGDTLEDRMGSGYKGWRRGNVEGRESRRGIGERKGENGRKRERLSSAPKLLSRSKRDRRKRKGIDEPSSPSEPT